MPVGGKPLHLHPDLGEDRRRGHLPDPRHRIKCGQVGRERGRGARHLLVQLLDGALQEAQVVQAGLDQQAMVRPDPPDERLLQGLQLPLIAYEMTSVCQPAALFAIFGSG